MKIIVINITKIKKQCSQNIFAYIKQVSLTKYKWLLINLDQKNYHKFQ